MQTFTARDKTTQSDTTKIASLAIFVLAENVGKAKEDAKMCRRRTQPLNEFGQATARNNVDSGKERNQKQEAKTTKIPTNNNSKNTKVAVNQ